MAIRHRLIEADLRTVWAVLSDGDRYTEWVVGTSASRQVRGRWPQMDAAISYEVRLGPVRLSNETVVRRVEEPTELELEAHAGPLGTARIAFELRPWGERCLIIADEHPLNGVGGLLHNAGAEVVIQLRHRAMLARLARICESRQKEGRQETEKAATGAQPSETAGAPGPGGPGA
ncbi:SRPBCC family protein [Streptomyces sp. NBC_00582]|uniref:SRPBCC family protein n=1 Tax=Streptomyces sp. NBC_00582 TaxID=2975783 RepID=UPI0010645DD8|nr:SRPBCC family protein [Streptomyces sp. NBC_00582]WUB66982.1 SRPBCC family protein [Streptomyces sp. NBC_00582]